VAPEVNRYEVSVLPRPLPRPSPEGLPVALG